MSFNRKDFSGSGAGKMRVVPSSRRIGVSASFASCKAARPSAPTRTRSPGHTVSSRPAACARGAPERSTTTGPCNGDDPGHPRLAALGVYPASGAKERDQDRSPSPTAPVDAHNAFPPSAWRLVSYNHELTPRNRKCQDANQHGGRDHDRPPARPPGSVASAVIGWSPRDRTEILRREAGFVIAAYPFEAATKPSITPLTREVLFHSSLVTYFLDFPPTRRTRT